MATNPTDTLRWYINDLIAAHRHVVEAMRRNQNVDSLKEVPGAWQCVASGVKTLDSNIAALEKLAKSMGGQGAVGTAKETLTTVTGFLAGIYGQARPQAGARVMRDDILALDFVLICATMLHATARALNDGATTDVTRSIMQGLTPLIMRMNEVLPAAVVHDLTEDHPNLNHGSVDQTVTEIKDAWHVATPAAT